MTIDNNTLSFKGLDNSSQNNPAHNQPSPMGQLAAAPQTVKPRVCRKLEQLPMDNIAYIISFLEYPRDSAKLMLVSKTMDRVTQESVKQIYHQQLECGYPGTIKWGNDPYKNDKGRVCSPGYKLAKIVVALNAQAKELEKSYIEELGDQASNAKKQEIRSIRHDMVKNFNNMLKKRNSSKVMSIYENMLSYRIKNPAANKNNSQRFANRVKNWIFGLNKVEQDLELEKRNNFIGFNIKDTTGSEIFSFGKKTSLDGKNWQGRFEFNKSANKKFMVQGNTTWPDLDLKWSKNGRFEYNENYNRMEMVEGEFADGKGNSFKGRFKADQSNREKYLFNGTLKIKSDGKDEVVIKGLFEIDDRTNMATLIKHYT
ncbi:MAG: hypothetical protein GY874_10675 [Desulfobacteraceae bacterium]|nr:hypothetical protein [Desulfobacteraceae bacterium]